MDDDDDDLDYDPNSAEIVAARTAVAKAISDYVTAIRPDKSPFVVAWAVGVEWTNAELEQKQAACRDIITNQDQPISATSGLGRYLMVSFD